MFFFVGVGGYLSYAGTFLYLPLLNDEGHLLYGGVRALQGQRPVADFWAYPAGRYWSFAAWSEVFGISVGVERALRQCHVGKMYRMERGAAIDALTPAVLAALTITLAPGPWHKFHYSLLLFAQLTALLFYLDRPNTRRAGCRGLLAGAAFYFRRDSAAYGLIACAVPISLARLPWRRPRTWLTHGFSVLGGFPLMLCRWRWCIGTTCRWFCAGGRPGDHHERRVCDGDFVSPRRMLGALGPHLAHRPDRLVPRGFLSLVTAVIVIIGASSRLWGRHTQSCADPGAGPAEADMGGGGDQLGANADQYVQAAGGDHGADGRRGSGRVGFAMTRRLWRRRQWAVVGGVECDGVGVAAGADDGGGVRRHGGGSWPRSYREAGELRVPRATLELDAKQAATLERLVALVQARTTPEQTIYAWRQPMLYVLCERDNATLTDSTVPPVFLRDWQEHMLEVFTQRPPALQILSADRDGRGWSWIAAKYPPQLRTAMFAGYRVTDDLGAYLVLEYTGQGDAMTTVRWLQKKLDGAPQSAAGRGRL